MKYTLAFTISLLVLLQPLCAETYVGQTRIEGKTLDQASFMGPTHLINVKVNSLTAHGPFNFQNLIVQNNAKIIGPVTKSAMGRFNDLNIIGPLTARNVICHSLRVEGPAEVTQLTVRGYASIIGSIDVRQSFFTDLNAQSDDISLDDTQVNNILIKQGKAINQVLRLKGNTLVKGNIIFETSHGIVEQDPEVKVLGRIMGATIKMMPKPKN